MIDKRPVDVANSKSTISRSDAVRYRRGPLVGTEVRIPAGAMPGLSETTYAVAWLPFGILTIRTNEELRESGLYPRLIDPVGIHISAFVITFENETVNLGVSFNLQFRCRLYRS